MKNIKLIIILFINHIASAQEYKHIDKIIYNCYYQYNFQVDSNYSDTYGSQEMILQIGSKLSKFISINKLYSDSLLEIHKDEDPGLAFNKIWPMIQNSRSHNYCDYSIYKHYPIKNKITLTNYINKKYFKVFETLPFQWQIITNNDTTILGYNCKKATTSYGGRNYIAWFSTNIPINDGPYKFCGLPGLIVKINDTKNQHSFELTSLQRIKHNSPIVYFEEKYIEITPIEYVKAFNAKMAELYDRVQSQTKIKFNDEESRIKALDRIKSKNNYIEKY